MAEKRTDLEMSPLYLTLANECFNKASIEEHAGGAEVFRRMGRCYLSEAAALDATLGQKMASTNVASSSSKPRR
jgi:hypothetical protein